MKLERRQFLMITATAVAALATGSAWWAWDRGVFSSGDGPAYEPWETWQDPAALRPLALVRAAILASNPHNSQPWLFRVSESAVELRPDPERNIGAMDPYRREMQIGLGCALENLLLAAAAEGYDPRVEIAGGSDPVIRIDLSEGRPWVTDLYQAIPRRHTNRGKYDLSRPPGPELLAQLADAGGEADVVRVIWFTGDADRKRVGDLIIAATEQIVGDPEQMAASSRWERMDWQSVQTFRDGITLDAQGLPTWMRVLGKVLPTTSPEQGAKFWLDATRNRYVGTAPAFGIIAVPDSQDPACRIRGGQVWQRMHLRATVHGLGMQPLNQLTERADRERVLGLEPVFGNALRDLVPSGWEALMSFRCGYPMDEALPSPRRGVEQVVQKG